MDHVRAGLLRALCFHDAWGYPPTLPELFAAWDAGPHLADHAPTWKELEDALASLRGAGMVTISRGRAFLSQQEELAREHEKREAFFPRKLRRARRVARWLASLGGVRFVALCNTTALAHARDGGDLDFFVITRAETIWQTRGWATLPFKMIGIRPSTDPRSSREERDAVCLSFFVDDSTLDLSSLLLLAYLPTRLLDSHDDPYFRHWFLSLLPLVDDGVSTELWSANSPLTRRHPLARRWIINPELRMADCGLRIPTPRPLEHLAHRLQARALPPAIRERMNRDTTVVASDHVLKFHVEDGRQGYAEAYRERCRRYGIEA